METPSLIIQKKIRILLFLIIFCSTMLPMEQRVYKLRLDHHTSSFLYPYCSEMFYTSLLKNYALKEEEVVAIVIQHLNDKTLGVELVSQIPIEDKSRLSTFIPKLVFNNSPEDPIIRWDIQAIEERAIRHALHQKKRRMKEKEKFKTQYIILEKGSTPRTESMSIPLHNDLLHVHALDAKEEDHLSYSCNSTTKDAPDGTPNCSKNWFKNHPFATNALVACCVGTVGVASGWLAHAWWHAR